MSIIDDLMQGLGKEASKIQARGQELMKAYNLAQEIRELDRKKTAKLIEIGRLVYDKYERQDDISEELLKEKVKETVIISAATTQAQAVPNPTLKPANMLGRAQGIIICR